MDTGGMKKGEVVVVNAKNPVPVGETVLVGGRNPGGYNHYLAVVRDWRDGLATVVIDCWIIGNAPFHPNCVYHEATP